MAYEGIIATIPLGGAGIQTDNPDTITEPVKLARANNVCLNENVLEKDFGSERWNQTVMPSGVRAFVDWWPTPDFQRMIAVGQNGKVYRFKHDYAAPTEVTPVATAPAAMLISQFVTIAKGGDEETSRNRKLFIFSGNDPVQVISGDATVRSDIADPPADWTGRTQPIKGLVHRSRLWAIMGHQAYASSATDHEDFTTNTIQFPIYPGESERLIDLFVYKTRLLFLKYPTGLYMLNDASADPADWTIDRVNGDFGGASPFSAQGVMDDVIVANNFGTATSLAASFNLGDVTSADLFNSMKVDKYIQENFSLSSGDERHCLYYPTKKVFYCTYRQAGSVVKDTIAQVNLKTASPELTVATKDLPLCLGLVKDVYGVGRPMYGANDGYIYRMDSVNRNVGGSAYTADIWTHDMDFAAGDAPHSENQKHFEFVEVVYIPTGEFDLSVQAFVDGRLVQTSSVSLKGESQSMLDQMVLDSPDVELLAKTSAVCPSSERIPMQAMGRRITVRLYNGTVNQNFKLLKLNVYYRMSEQQQVRK